MANYPQFQQNELVGPTSEIVYVNICRICLEPGEIPIFGDDEKPDISTEIVAFGSIEVSYSDKLPQHICNFCHELLQGAILFRNTAKKSHKTLLEVKAVNYNMENSNSSESNALKIAEQLSSNENYNSEDKSEEIKDNNEISDSETIMIVVSENKNNYESLTSNIHTCDICIMDFSTSDDYYQHIRTSDHINHVKRAQKVECNICRKLICKVYYVSHIIKHSFEPILIGDATYKCKICNKILLSEQDLKMHKDSELHKISIRDAYKIDCPICQERLEKDNLKLHVKSHVSVLDKDVKQKCQICNKYFNHIYYYSHLQRMHNIDYKMEIGELSTTKNESKLPFVCDKCGKVFRRPSSFKLHCQTHGGELKYKCMFCPYRGLHQGLLKIHVRTHTGDYNYKCTECPARFTTKSNLSKHLRKHLGPIDFKCTTCHRGFYSKLELERHNTVDHLGVKNHVCNICGKAFGYRNSMMSHSLKVHKREKLTEGKGRPANYLLAKIDEKN